jgi:hypothetical protein
MREDQQRTTSARSILTARWGHAHGVTLARGLPLNLWMTTVIEERSILSDGGVARGVRGLATNVTRL